MSIILIIMIMMAVCTFNVLAANASDIRKHYGRRYE